MNVEKFVVGGTSSSGRALGINAYVITSDGSSEAVWQSSSSKVAVHCPRRLVKPSMYKVSPYVIPNSKIRVSNKEAKLYEAVLRMGQTNEYVT